MRMRILLAGTIVLFAIAAGEFHICE